MKERGFRDRDFMSTKEGFLFCVVGPYHPDDRVISYLKYLPDRRGRWRKGKERFKRVMQTYTIPSLLETFDLLKRKHPQFLFYSPAYNITLSAVPQEHICKQFKPEEKLTELFKMSPLDSLQRKVIRLASLLSELSTVQTRNLGVTGSILMDIHNVAFSDVDITVYGVKSSYALKNALTKAYSIENVNVRRLEGNKLKNWYTNKTRKHPINLVEAQQIYERKWNIGIFDNTIFSVHPVKLEKELSEKYGDKTYRSSRIVTATAVVSDSEDSIFLPAIYKVTEVKVEGETDLNIEEVASYEGLYDSLAEKDEAIEVRGKLEHVIDNRTGKEYDRILVGSPEGEGGEYIKHTDMHSYHHKS